MANERTFLAWIRTSLAFIAGGLAVIQFAPEFGYSGGRRILGVALILLGTVLAVGSAIRWASSEEAMREDRPLPDTRLPLVLIGGVLGAMVLVAALLFFG